jgi:Repeat of unknown function (DUF346)
MSEVRLLRRRPLPIATTVSLLTALMLLIAGGADSAKAAERPFCSGANLDPGQGCVGGYGYNKSGWAWSETGTICLYVDEVGVDCQIKENEQVTVTKDGYGYLGNATIINWSTSGKKAKVYGIVWDGSPPPPPPPPPAPSWHGPFSLGGAIVGDPDVASWGSGRLDAFARGTNDALHINSHISGTWTGWINLGGPALSSGPGAVSWGYNRLDVVGRASNGSVTHWWYDGSNWGNENLGGSIVGSPDISSWGSGRLDIFARGTSDTLQHKWYTPGTGWSAWESLGGTITSGPGAVSWGSNRIDVVARAADGSVTHRWYDGANWGSENLGGAILGEPDISSWGSGRLDVFVRGTNDALHHKWYQGSWSGWENKGGGLTSGPGAVSWGKERIDVFGRATDGSVSQWYYGQ